MAPTAKPKPAAVAASPPLQRALDFSSPPPEVGADGSAKLNENEMQKTWKGSLIKLKSGKILQCAGVEFNKAKPMESIVLFRPGASGATAARHSLKVLLDPAARANACHSIILGFLGGTFGADGLSVRVTKVKAAKGTIESVLYSPLDGSGKALGVSDDTPIEEFIEDFKPTQMTAAQMTGDSANPVGFDFSPYPLILGVLRVSRALDPEITALPFKDAISYLASFNAVPIPEEPNNAIASALAADAEALLASEKASPELKKLKRVAKSGSLATSTLGDKAKAARSFAFKSGSAPPPPAEVEKPAKKVKPAAKKGAKRARTEELAKASSEDESDDSESGSSDDSGSDAPKTADEPPKKAAKVAVKISKKASAEEDEIVSRPSLLNSMTPAGMTEAEAAEVIFESPALRAAASIEVAPEGSGVSEARLAKRYDLALTHIQRLLPEGIVKWRRPSSRVALELWSEEAADAIARPPKPRTAGETPPGRKGESPRREDGPEDARSSKPSEGISVEKGVAAVTSDTASRLHAGIETIARAACVTSASTDTQQPINILAAISDTPGQLRGELQRGLVSNGRVDDAGEHALTRRSLPPLVQKMRKGRIRVIEAVLSDVPKADTTRQLRLPLGTIRSLADRTSEMRSTWKDYTAAATEMFGARASKVGSHQGNLEAWGLMYPAYTKAVEMLGIDSAGLSDINRRVTAPEAVSRLSPSDIAEWLDRVFDDIANQTHAFLHDELAPAPSIAAAVAAFEEGFRYLSIQAALWGKGKGKGKGKGGERDEPGREREPRGKGKGKGNEGKGKGKDPLASATAWPEKKAMLSNEKFQASREAAVAKYPALCPYFLLSKCSKGKCSKEHKKPDDFAAFIGTQGLNMDGSEKCTHPISNPHPRGEPREPVGPSEPAPPAQSERPQPPEPSEPPAPLEPSEPPEPTEPSELLELQEPSETLEYPRPSEELEPRRPSEVLEPQEPSETLEYPRPSEELEPQRPSELLEPQEPSERLAYPRPSEELEPQEPSEVLEPQGPSEMLEYPRPSEVLEPRDPGRRERRIALFLRAEPTVWDDQSKSWPSESLEPLRPSETLEPQEPSELLELRMPSEPLEPLPDPKEAPKPAEAVRPRPPHPSTRSDPS
jgi:hypothetical protein